MKTSIITITGTSAILLSCDTLADPLDPRTVEHKRLTATRGKAKTDEVVLAIAKSQYINGVYYNEQTGVHIPAINIKKCLEEGAKLTRDGDKVRKGVMIMEDCVPLEYGQKLTPLQLWDKGAEFLDKRSVVVGQAKVMCYRPKFSTWSLTFEIDYDEDIIQPSFIENYFSAAGKYVGLGGFRPAKNGMFGRFTVELS